VQGRNVPHKKRIFLFREEGEEGTASQHNLFIFVYKPFQNPDRLFLYKYII
jgi:hypothetical protein